MTGAFYIGNIAMRMTFPVSLDKMIIFQIALHGKPVYSGKWRSECLRMKYIPNVVTGEEQQSFDRLLQAALSRQKTTSNVFTQFHEEGTVSWNF